MFSDIKDIKQGILKEKTQNLKTLDCIIINQCSKEAK